MSHIKPISKCRALEKGKVQERAVQRSVAARSPYGATVHILESAIFRIKYKSQ